MKALLLAQRDCRLLVNKLPDKSIMECVKNYCDKSMNIESYFIDVDCNGYVDLEQLEDILNLNYSRHRLVIAPTQGKY